MDNELLSEGDAKDFNQDKSNRPSSDVVFLLDLKKCNEPDTTSARFLPSLINALEKELIIQKFTKNRYSLIAFGGKKRFSNFFLVITSLQLKFVIQVKLHTTNLESEL